MKDLGTRGVIYGASLIASVEAWEYPEQQRIIWDMLRQTIRTEHDGSGTREYQEVIFGRLTEAGEFWAQVLTGTAPSHVMAYLELSP